MSNTTRVALLVALMVTTLTGCRFGDSARRFAIHSLTTATLQWLLPSPMEQQRTRPAVVATTQRESEDEQTAAEPADAPEPEEAMVADSYDGADGSHPAQSEITVVASRDEVRTSLPADQTFATVCPIAAAKAKAMRADAEKAARAFEVAVVAAQPAITAKCIADLVRSRKIQPRELSRMARLEVRQAMNGQRIILMTEVPVEAPVEEPVEVPVTTVRG